MAEVIDTMALFAWFHRDALVARLEAEIDTLADDAAALSSQEREQRLAEIAADRLIAERAECALLSRMQADGPPIEHRVEADPRAVLAVELVADETPVAAPFGLTCIDAGGHHAHAVYSYCRHRKGLVAIRGKAGPKPIWSGRASRTKSVHRVFWCGVDTDKDVIYSRLRFSEPGPGYVHFPTGGLFTEEYFRQLTAEEVATRYSEGRPYRVWTLPPGRRNEALDTFNYALTARTGLPYRLDVAPVEKWPTPKPSPPMTTLAEFRGCGEGASRAAAGTISERGAAGPDDRSQLVSRAMTLALETTSDTQRGGALVPGSGLTRIADISAPSASFGYGAKD